MYHCGMRQMEEKHVANQVDLMVWSNRLDLLAISNAKGEVQVHRLHWQKVWSFAPPKDNDIVKAIAWRPDGKALAIGYSSGCVCIVDIEDKEILNKFFLGNERSDEFEVSNATEVTCISWPMKNGTIDTNTDNFYDDATLFLPDPTTLSNCYKCRNGESTKDIKVFKQQSNLNMLLIGYGSGHIHLNIFGCYPFGTFNIAQLVNDECGEYKILDLNLSDDFSAMQVLYYDLTCNGIFTVIINTTMLSAHTEEVFNVARKHGSIVQLVTCLDQTMISISEAWEQILMEMDMKMTDYAASVQEGGVSADFLELLMMGVPSDQLELFLLKDLTAKGLKKFGSSVELSYSTIQKLVLKQLNIIAQSLTYYLSEFRGITRVPERFQIIGLQEEKVTTAIKACFAFLNKCLELQQVIDVSMRNYKSFFRWLFVVIVRLLDEQTPSEIVKITQQELTHIAEFLYNFDKIKVDDSEEKTQDKPVKFNLERLGQYLQNQDLTILSDDDDNLWQKMLKENTCLIKDHDTIFSVSEFKKFSLVQQQNHLKYAIFDVFDVTDKNIGQHFWEIFNLKLCVTRDGTDLYNDLRFSHFYDTDNQNYMVALADRKLGAEGLSFMSVSLKELSNNAVKYNFGSSLLDPNSENTSQDKLTVLDLQFYSHQYLSVLVKHPNINDSSMFVQLPLKIAIENAKDFNINTKHLVFNDNVVSLDISPLLHNQFSSFDQKLLYKVLDKMDGYQIAVSGGRKVAVVLSKSCKKVRIFEMEVDGDEDEDTLDITPQSNNVTPISENSWLWMASDK